MKLILILATYAIATLLPGNRLFGQSNEDSKLILHISPKNAIIILDTAHVHQGQVLDVSPGVHFVTSWAPTRVLEKDTIQTYTDSVIVYLKHLAFTQEFQQYRIEVKGQRAKALFPLISTCGVLVVSSVLCGGLTLKMDDYYDQAMVAKLEYDKAITQPQLDHYENQYNDYNKKYENLRTTNNAIAIGGSVLVAAGVTYTLYILLKKPPPFHEEPLLSRINAGLLLEKEDALAIALMYKF